MRTDAENRDLLRKKGVAFEGEGVVVEVRYHMGTNGWYCRTNDEQGDHLSWWWWDGKQWKSSIYGPTV